MTEDKLKATFIAFAQSLVDECKFIYHLHDVVGLDTTRGEVSKFASASWDKAEKLGDALGLPRFCNNEYNTITWWLESVWLGSDEGCSGSYEEDGKTIEYTIKTPEDLWEAIKRDLESVEKEKENGDSGD